MKTISFPNLLKYYIMTYRRQTLMQIALILAITAVLVAWFCFSENKRYSYTDAYYMSFDPACNFEFALFAFVMLVTAAIGAGNTMGGFTSKERRISSLMLPASQSSKYLANAVIYLILMPILIIIGLYVIDIVRVAILSSLYPNSNRIFFFSFENADIEWEEMAQYFIPFFLAFQATFALGAVVVPKGAVIKTAIFVFAWIVIMFFVGSVVLNFALNPDMHYKGDIKDWMGGYFFTFLSLIYCIVCYAIAYLRYKEIEIIQRW